MKRFLRRPSLTTWSLVALAAGFLLAALGNATHVPGLAALAAVLRPVGALWLAALRMIVLPLVITLLLAGMVGSGGTTSVGRLAGRTLLLFVAMLVAAAALALALAPPMVAAYRIAPQTVASLRATAPISAAAPPAATAGASVGEWIAGLLPTNLFAAAANGDVLPLLFFAALFGIAVTRLPDEQREPLTRGILGFASAMLAVVRWILWFTPLGVFALVFLFTREVGGEVIGFMGAYVVIVSAVLLVATLLLYPATVLFGRVSFRAFARAAAPAQLVALSTRSSLASLPALVQGASEHLRLPTFATGLVLPLSVSVFKLNRLVSPPVKLLFLAHVFGISLTPATLVSFLVGCLLVSFATPGTPGTGPIGTLPLYLAAGMPIEGIVLLEAVEVIPDIFKTVLNVTGDMSAATIVSRSAFAAPAPAPAIEAAAA